MFDNVYELQKHIFQNVSAEYQRPIFERLLTTIFADIKEVQLDLATEKVTVLQRNLNYLQKIIDFLVKQPEENLELYMWWSMVQTIAPESTKELYTNFLHSVSVERHCASFVFGLMTPVFAAQKNKNFDYGRVQEFIKLLKKEFIILLENCKWMEASTKASAIEKIDAISYYVGGPKMEELDLIYNEVRICIPF
jgi:predicted metalloendopeptidase